MRAAVAILGVLLGLLWTSPAHAGPWQVGRATAVANKAWGYPCGGRPAIRYADGSRDLDRDAMTRFDAWVIFRGVDGALVPDCEINLAPAMRHAEWDHVCRVLLHEWGHLAGVYGHDNDPDSIMHESPRNDPRCRQRGRPFLGLPEPRTAAGRARFARVFDG